MKKSTCGFREKDKEKCFNGKFYPQFKFMVQIKKIPLQCRAHYKPNFNVKYIYKILNKINLDHKNWGWWENRV